MATKQPLPPPAEVTPVVPPAAVEAPPKPKGPTVEFIGEGADNVIFSANPKAKHIKVFADGMVVETL